MQHVFSVLLLVVFLGVANAASFSTVKKGNLAKVSVLQKEAIQAMVDAARKNEKRTSSSSPSTKAPGKGVTLESYAEMGCLGAKTELTLPTDTCLESSVANTTSQKIVKTDLECAMIQPSVKGSNCSSSGDLPVVRMPCGFCYPTDPAHPALGYNSFYCDSEKQYVVAALMCDHTCTNCDDYQVYHHNECSRYGPKRADTDIKLLKVGMCPAVRQTFYKEPLSPTLQCRANDEVAEDKLLCNECFGYGKINCG